MSAKFNITLFGSFAVTAPDGRSLTPHANKSKGLLALLCTTPDMRRGRRWIEAKLWSDRGQAQASGSLRQSLIDIRTAFGDHADLLGSDRSAIWLNVGLVTTDLATGGAGDREMLEDVDIRDEAFEEWLRDLRASHDAQLATAPPSATPPGVSRLSIRSALSDNGNMAERITARIIGDQIATGLEERLSAVRYVARDRLGPGAEADLEVRCDIAQDAERAVVYVRIEDGRDGRLIFSDHRSVHGTVSDAISSETIGGLVHSATVRAVHRLPNFLDLSRPEASALGYSNLGLKKLATFEAKGFADAQGYFAKAYDEDANGVYLAWQAFVRMAQLVERVEGDSASWRDEVNSLIPRAMSASHDNGLAIALVALTRIMLEDDLSGPAELAKSAIQWNRSNQFAQQTLAVANTAMGRSEQAYALSLTCQQSGQDDELRHVWDLYHSLVCIGAGRLDEARQAAERASARAPGFVAPRRQLVALCAHAGDVDAAVTHLNELRRIESGFSLDRYLNDPDYPILTLRNAGLVQPLRKTLPND